MKETLEKAEALRRGRQKLKHNVTHVERSSAAGAPSAHGPSGAISLHIRAGIGARS